jgi:hypothetical protein
MLRRESPNPLGKGLGGAQSQSARSGKKNENSSAGTLTPFVQSLAQSIYQATPTDDSFRNDQVCIFRQLWRIYSNRQPRCVLVTYVICVPSAVTCVISNSWKAPLYGAESINFSKLI